MTQSEPLLSMENATYRVAALMPRPAQDRRSRVRFPIDLPLRYRTLDRTHRSGTGRTLNISSAGALVTCRERLPLDINVELTIAWPAMLHDRIPLNLIITGGIIRSEAHRFAMAECHHRFRPVAPAPVALEIVGERSAQPEDQTKPIEADAIDAGETQPLLAADALLLHYGSSLPDLFPWVRR